MAAIMEVENPGNPWMETRLGFSIGIVLDFWRYVILVRTVRSASRRAGVCSYDNTVLPLKRPPLFYFILFIYLSIYLFIYLFFFGVGGVGGGGWGWGGGGGGGGGGGTKE